MYFLKVYCYFIWDCKESVDQFVQNEYLNNIVSSQEGIVFVNTVCPSVTEYSFQCTDFVRLATL